MAPPTPAIPEDARERILKIFDQLPTHQRYGISCKLDEWRQKPCHDYHSWQDAFVTLTWRRLHELAIHTGKPEEGHLKWLEQTGDLDFLVEQMYPQGTYRFDPYPEGRRHHRLATFDPGHPPKED